MTEVLALYYSAYGHVETLAREIAVCASAAGATTDGKREVSENELAGARYQGRRIADVAVKLNG